MKGGVNRLILLIPPIAMARDDPGKIYQCLELNTILHANAR